MYCIYYYNIINSNYFNSFRVDVICFRASSSSGECWIRLPEINKYLRVDIRKRWSLCGGDCGVKRWVTTPVCRGFFQLFRDVETQLLALISRVCVYLSVRWWATAPQRLGDANNTLCLHTLGSNPSQSHYTFYYIKPTTYVAHQRHPNSSFDMRLHIFFWVFHSWLGNGRR